MNYIQNLQFVSFKLGKNKGANEPSMLLAKQALLAQNLS